MADHRPPGVHVEETESGNSRHGSGWTDSSGRPEPKKVELDVSTVTVSLAIQLVEGATGGKPVEIPAVSVEGVDAKPRLKSDRFLLFLDVELPVPPTPTVVSVDGGDRYRDVTHQVVVTEQDDLPVPAEVEVYPPSKPVVPVWLFAEDATVLRGYVRDTDGNRIEGGELRVTDLDFDLAAKIDPNGRFVLYLEDTPDDVDVETELELDELEDPIPVTLPVVEEIETVRTLVVDVDAETVTVHEGII